MTTSLVVGGTSGIGLATAVRLAALGDTVHVVGRDKERLDTVAATHTDLVAHRADGGQREDIAAIAAGLGTIDRLVVTLSGSEGMGPLADLDLAVLRRAFDAKFWAHLTTLQTVLPHLDRGGSITLVGAITAHLAMPGTAGLAAINAAVEALVRPLAVELAPIRVNAVSPGVVDTPWWRGMPDEAREEYFTHVARTLPSRHIATADDIAEVVVLAATNRNLTGTIVQSDGGARLVTV